MSRRRIQEVLVTFAILVLLSCLGIAEPLQLAVELTIGWARYAGRHGPEVRVSWAWVAKGAVGLALFAAGLHGTLNWLYRRQPVRSHVRWPAKWTVAATGLVLVVFAAGIAAAMVVREVGGLATAPGPAFVSMYGAGGRRGQALNNMRQIGLGVEGYVHHAEGMFPPGATFTPTGRALHGWQTAILPFVEQQPLYNAIDFGVPWDDPANDVAREQVISLYSSPDMAVSHDRDGCALTAVAGNARVLRAGRGFPLDGIRDGKATTILLGSVSANYRPWAEPGNTRDPARGITGQAETFGSPSGDYAIFVMADGSTRVIRDTIDPRVLKALATPDGGETIDPDEYGIDSR